MIKIQPNSVSNTNFEGLFSILRGRKNVKAQAASDAIRNSKESDDIQKKQAEQNIKNSLNALAAHQILIEDSSKQILKELRAIQAKNYPIKDLKELEYKAQLTAGSLPGPVAFPKHPLSIWGGMYVDLNDGETLTKEAKELMANDIANVLAGKTEMKEVTDPKVWSVSYEFTNGVGGQKDIAREMPDAMSKAGVDTFAIAPMIFFQNNGNQINYTEKTPDGKRYYVTGTKNNKIKTEITKVYSADVKSGNKTTKMDVYYGVFADKSGKKIKTLFLYDNDKFALGDVKDCDAPNEYASTKKSPERVRMAQFNNLTYELLAAAKEGKINLPDGTELPAPDKIVAHEAWQQGGLLGKLRLYSRAEDSIHSKPLETTEYLRDIANNTAVVIHNLGDGYQGQEGSKDVIEGYFNTLYGDFARDIVENSCIADKGDNKFELFGKPEQRIGFVKEILNPAHGAAVLATTIGPVSEGYRSEIVNDKISSKLDPVMKLKDKYNSLVALPNGVDKASLAASPENVEKVNKAFAEKINELTGEDIEILPYSEDMSLEEFAAAKENNKELFVKVLKDAVDHNEELTPLTLKGPKEVVVEGVKRTSIPPSFFLGKTGISLEGATKDTPIFSMASRLDAQKGFDTMVDAYAGLVEKYEADDPNLPILVISGGGNKEIAEYIKKVKDELGDKGRRILFTQDRISDPGLLFMNMTTRNCMPSDFEPYGISELKGLYAGSHVIANEVGGMKSEGKISRKIYSYDDFDTDKANAVTVKDYKFMCLAHGDEKEAARVHNAKKLTEAMEKDINLSKEDSYKMDMNALKTDVSWDKGAIQNYMKVMKINTTHGLNTTQG